MARAVLSEKLEVDLNELVREMAEKSSRRGGGALVIFVGFVKGVVDGRRVLELVYEAYEPYASKALSELASKYETLEGVHEVRVYHRLGAVKPGEPALVVAVTAVDRKKALSVVQQLLEEVKHGIPVFKKERREDGTYWVLGDGLRIPPPSTHPPRKEPPSRDIEGSTSAVQQDPHPV